MFKTLRKRIVIELRNELICRNDTGGGLWTIIG